MMNDTGITFSWHEADILGGLLGFMAGKVIDKILGKDWYKRTKIVSEDVEGQFDLTKDIADKHKFKITNFDLRKEFKPICNGSENDARTAHNVGCNIRHRRSEAVS
jgi:hypothetical protein